MSDEEDDSLREMAKPAKKKKKAPVTVPDEEMGSESSFESPRRKKSSLSKSFVQSVKHEPDGPVMLGTNSGGRRASSRNSFVNVPKTRFGTFMDSLGSCGKGAPDDDEEREGYDVRKAYLQQRMWYKWDSWISQPVYQSYVLAVIAFLLTAGGGLAYAYVAQISIGDGVWAAWTWIAAGILGVRSPPEGLWERSTSSIITVLGILYFSIVLGLVVEAVQAKMDSLRKGKSKVVEKDHTVMLGWTDKSLSFINEIVDANSSEGGGVIAVLCDRDKEEMDEIMKSYHTKKTLQGTKVVFRKGSRLMIQDLSKVCVENARAVVVLSADGCAPDAADAEVLQICLNLQNVDCKGHTVCEVRDKDNEPLIHLIGRGNIECIVSHDIIGRLMLMSVRQPGLSQVYGSVLGFEGDEFYMRNWPQLTNKPWSDVTFCFPDAIPIGIRVGGEGGPIVLNPEHGHRLGPEDDVIVIAEDDDSYSAESKITVDQMEQHEAEAEYPRIEKVFFAGWRRDIRDMIILLDQLCTEGSELHILATVPLNERDVELERSGLDLALLENIRLVHHWGSTNERRCLEGLHDLKDITSAICFADDADESDIMRSDSRCLSTLLLVRDLMMRSQQQERNTTIWDAREEIYQVPIVTEILDPRTQETISRNPNMRSLSFFLQSNNLVSKILAMVAENREVATILNEMLAPEGAALATKSAMRYAGDHESLSFWQMAKRVQMQGEILVGYAEPASPEDDENEDVVFGFMPPEINPRDKTTKRNWEGINLCVLSGGPATPAKPKKKRPRRKSIRGKSPWMRTVSNIPMMELVECMGIRMGELNSDERGAAVTELQAVVPELNTGLNNGMDILARDLMQIKQELAGRRPDALQSAIKTDLAAVVNTVKAELQDSIKASSHSMVLQITGRSAATTPLEQRHSGNLFQPKPDSLTTQMVHSVPQQAPPPPGQPPGSWAHEHSDISYTARSHHSGSLGTTSGSAPAPGHPQQLLPMQANKVTTFTSSATYYTSPQAAYAPNQVVPMNYYDGSTHVHVPAAQPVQPRVRRGFPGKRTVAGDLQALPADSGDKQGWQQNGQGWQQNKQDWQQHGHTGQNGYYAPHQYGQQVAGHPQPVAAEQYAQYTQHHQTVV